MSIIKKWKKSELKDWANNIEESKRTLYEIILNVIIFSILETVVGFFLVNKIIKFIIGIIIGTIVAVLLVRNMYSVIDKALDEDESSAEKISRKWAIIRTTLVFIILLLIIRFKKYINVYASVIAILNLKFAAYLQPFTNKYIFKKYVTKGR